MPDELRARTWSELSSAVLGEPLIREFYANRGPHRVSRYRYPAGASFDGVSRPADCYVLEGCCRYDFEAGFVELLRGQFSALPAGAFRFQVLGGVPVDLVLAWKLPDSILG